jgi:antitoxin component YwqK of YwqJK toxin-antitoxin module
MVKKFLIISFLSILVLSCNKVIDAVDEVRMNKKQTITYDDYETIINDHDIKLYYDNDKELMTGHFMVVYKAKLSEEFQTKRGFLNGVYVSYNADGQLSKVFNYINGRKHGLQQHFYDTGELSSEATFEKGKIVGDEISYDKAGEIKVKTKFENGIKYKRYYNGGKLTMAEFKKNWEGKELEMLVHYDAFENIQFAFGKSNDTAEKNIFYVFDANMQLTDTVDVILNPQKANYYLGLIRNTSASLIE